MRVVLDSTEIVADYRMASGPFRALKEGIESFGFSLHLPCLVIAEVLNRYRRGVQEAVERDRAAHQSLRRFLWEGAPDTPPPIHSIDGLADAYGELLRLRLSALGVRELPYPQVSHETLVQRALSGRKPFSSDGQKGYRDALIWEGVLELASSGDEAIVFVTTNASDFAKDGELHPELAADVVARDIPVERVRLRLGLSAFSDTYLKPRLSRRALLSGEDQRLREPGVYDRFLETLQLAYREQLETIIGTSPAIPTGWRPVVHSVRPADEPLMVEVKSVAVFPSGSLLVSAETEVLVDFAIRQLNITMNGATAAFHATLDFILDPTSGDVTAPNLRSARLVHREGSRIIHP